MLVDSTLILINDLISSRVYKHYDRENGGERHQSYPLSVDPITTKQVFHLPATMCILQASMFWFKDTTVIYIKFQYGLKV